MKSPDLHHLTLSFILLLLSASVLALPDDRNQPIAVDSENLNSNGKNLFIYSGNVVITQGSLQVHADKVEIYGNNAGKFNKIIAIGKPARFQQKVLGSVNPLSGNAQRMEFVANTNTLQLTGEAYVDRDGNTLTADHIDYDLASEQIKAQSKSGERVEMIWKPEQKASQQPDSDSEQKAKP